MKSLVNLGWQERKRVVGTTGGERGKIRWKEAAVVDPIMGHTQPSSVPGPLTLLHLILPLSFPPYMMFMTLFSGEVAGGQFDNKCSKYRKYWIVELHKRGECGSIHASLSQN